MEYYYNPRHPSGFAGARQVRAEHREWLKSQDPYTLHKQIVRKFERNKTVAKGLNYQWQLDLVDLSSLEKHNDGNKFLLTCIDVFSRYACAVAIKNKTGIKVRDAFEKIIEERGIKPYVIQTDLGKEFYNSTFQKFLKENNINHFSTYSETKASLVERFHRTLKTRMYRYFTYTRSLRYVSVLSDLLHAYNHTVHTSLKMRPVDVTYKNESEVYNHLYGKKAINSVKFNFEIGEKVRISKQRLPFKKGYLPGWSKEIFKVKQKIARIPPVYVLEDLNGTEISGVFYEKELQQIIHKDNELYEIDKILKTRKRGTEYFVSWVGYPPEFNSWIDAIKVITNPN